jgi:hypothetical protein
MPRAHRRYNLILLAVLAPVVALLAVTGLLLEPYTGGLTRLGGYPEQRYGWNAPQQQFTKPLYRQFVTREAGYREPVDIVVVGDSFTYHEQVSWPNYLVQETGLRLHAFRLDKTPVEALLASERFRGQPPRILIYETVERELWNRFRGEGRSCRLLPPPGGRARPVLPMPIEAEAYSRPTRGALLDFSLAIDFLSKQIPREYFGRDRTPVKRLALSRPAPFSNLEKHQLLVYRDDLLKAHWTPAMWERIRCNLANLQNRVQANGKTFFIALIATDKLTAYSELLADESLRNLSHIDLLATDPGLHLPRLDLRLRRAIRDEVVDVYLNNDTHWGSAGYRIVARELVDYLTRAGVIAPVPRP